MRQSPGVKTRAAPWVSVVFSGACAMMRTTKMITGASLHETRIRVHETNQFVDVTSVLAVLRGNLAAYRIRGFVPLDACRQIAQNFWASAERVPRPGDGADGVEGYFIGASHYNKTTLEYLEEAHASKDAVQSLYAGTINPGGVFRD